VNLYYIIQMSNGNNAYNLRLSGYSITQLKTDSYTDEEILQAGYSAKELRLAGYLALQLKNAGYSNKSIIQGEYDNKQLKSVGIKTAYELRKMGYSAFQIAREGYSGKIFKELKFTPSELLDPEVPPSKMRSLGYSIADMKRAGFNVSQLLETGFQLRRIITAGYGLDDLLIANVEPKEIKNLKLPSLKTLYTPTELSNAGLSVSYLRLVGFTASELKEVGFTATDLRKGGYDSHAINDAGYSLTEMKDAGVFAYELTHVGYSVGDLISVGYNGSEIATTGLPFFTNVMVFGYTSMSGLVNFMTSENATSYNNAGVVVSGGIGIAKDLYLDELHAKSPINLDVSGPIVHDGSRLKFIHLLENGTIVFTLKENGKIECTGNVQFQFPNNTIVEINNEKLNIPCTTLATSTTTGALTSVGGISSQNNIYTPSFSVGDNQDIKTSSTGITTSSQTNIVVSESETMSIGKNNQNRVLSEGSATLQINGATGVAFSFSKQQANSQTSITDLTISTSGIVNVTNDAQSTTTTSGSLQNNGGMGVEKNVNVGGTVTVWDILNSGTIQQTGTTMRFSSGDSSGATPSATIALFSSSSSTSIVPSSMSNANLHTLAYNSVNSSSQKNIVSQSFPITSSHSLIEYVFISPNCFSFKPVYLKQGQVVKGIVFVSLTTGSIYRAGIYGKGFLPIRLAQTNNFTLAQGFNYIPLESSWTVPSTDVYYICDLTSVFTYTICINENIYLSYSTTTTPANGTLSKAVQFYGDGTSISGFTSRLTVLSGISTVVSGIAVNADQNRLVLIFYGGGIFYSTWNGSSWSTPVTTLNTTNRFWIGISMTSDGSRIAAIVRGGLCYYSTWNGSNYANPTQTLETTSRSYEGLDMTSDGSRIVTIVLNGKAYFSSWNGSNYAAFTETLDTTLIGAPGIAITNDGRRIAYFNNAFRLFYASWNGNNYTSPMDSVTLPSGSPRNVRFSSDYSYLILSTKGSSPIYYVSIVNSLFSSIQSIPTNILPTSNDGWPLAVSRDGITIYSGNYDTSFVYRTNIVYATQNLTISGFTTQSTVLSGTSTNITGIAINSQKNRIVLCVYNGGILYSTLSGSTWSTPTSTLNTTNRLWCGVAMSADGSRIAMVVSNGLCYYSTWNGSNYTNPTQTLETTTRNYTGIDMTSDGSRIVTSVTNGKIYFASWNGTNYTSFTQTLDTTVTANVGIGITNDGSRIAYFSNANPAILYYADWNGTNYTSSIASITLPTGSGISRNVRFSSDYSFLFMTTQGGNAPIYYVNIVNSLFSSIQSVPTNILPTTSDGWPLTLSRDGVTVYSGNYGSSIIYSTNINYISTLPSQIPNVAMKTSRYLVYGAVYS
jgi:hypothetical protein